MSSTIIPTMRYDDSKKAIDFLCKAFGFEKYQVYEDKSGQIVHAEFKHGTGLIMIGPMIGSELGKHIKLPKDVAGFATQVVFILIRDVEAHFVKSSEFGVEILMALTQKDYGSSNYTCHDHQGHI